MATVRDYCTPPLGDIQLASKYKKVLLKHLETFLSTLTLSNKTSLTSLPLDA